MAATLCNEVYFLRLTNGFNRAISLMFLIMHCFLMSTSNCKVALLKKELKACQCTVEICVIACIASATYFVIGRFLSMKWRPFSAPVNI